MLPLRCFFLNIMSLIVLFIAIPLGHINAQVVPVLPLIMEPEIISIEVYPHQHKLIVMKDHRLYRSYKVAVGDPSTPTPIGEFHIIYKGKDWGASFGPRWLGLDIPWGIYGIHGTNKPSSIGQHLSHGCIRMNNHDVKELYDLIPIGTKVTIYGHVLGELNREPRTLAEGDIGADVQLIQSRLKSAGYFFGRCDGKFRASTTVAVKQFQRDQGIISNGVVSEIIYERLGLVE